MSKEAIEGLKPEILWQRFYEITQVPRPSKKEEKIRTYLKDLAGKLNVNCSEDAAGTIVYTVPASKGYENAPTVVLQGHVDMVCEKNKNTEHDFDNDPISIVRDGDWITAEGTTLGADNGIGVAAALAIVSDDTAVHGPLELLFTIDEETGLTGANSLQPGFIKGKVLLNLDSEEDGAFYIGCSGGIDTQGSYRVQYEPAPRNGYNAYTLMVSGLKGGHSGLDISTGRANALKLLSRALKQINPGKYLLGGLTGGSKRNAIPREAEASLLIVSGNENEVMRVLKEFEENVRIEFGKIEPGVKITLEKAVSEVPQVFSAGFSDKLINTLLGLPHGVIAMNTDIPELVETSTNLATVTIEDGVLTIGTSQRSSIESAKRYVAASVAAVLNLSGAEVKTGDGYPGWKPNVNSPVLKLSAQMYESMFGSKPEVKAIHAGLECGILGDKYPGLDMVSFGPTIEGAHSPDERVNIPTTGKFYELLKAILAELAKQSI